jgi:hypothetical protein
MCSSNRADQHEHFPDRVVAYAASIRRGLNYGILSLQTQCKRFNQDCSKICSSLQQQAAAAASASAAAAAAALRRQIFRPLQMPLVRRSHRFGIIVLVHLEAAGKER